MGSTSPPRARDRRTSITCFLSMSTGLNFRIAALCSIDSDHEAWQSLAIPYFMLN